jgi:hypothetical protein
MNIEFFKPVEITIKREFIFLSKAENRKAKQVLSGGCYQWERGGHKERV